MQDDEDRFVSRVNALKPQLQGLSENEIFTVLNTEFSANEARRARVLLEQKF